MRGGDSEAQQVKHNTHTYTYPRYLDVQQMYFLIQYEVAVPQEAPCYSCRLV